LDTNHGYAKEQVVNSELAKRQLVTTGRHHRLESLAQACRARLASLKEQDDQLEAQVQAYEQRRSELSMQVTHFEEAGRREAREYFPVKARHVATAWEIRQHKAKLEKHAVRRQAILDKCEGYCRELRYVLRQQVDLEAQAREMYELDHARVPDHDGVEAGTRQCGHVGEGSVFWRELPPLWVAALTPLFQIGWVDHHDDERGAARTVCV
jgi:chromosome segregation ATPase